MNEPRSDTLSTYRHLRVAMVVLLGLLLVSVLLEAAISNCFAGSISAYYFTPVRAVFIATLCAVGTCLVVYKGRSPEEDLALNVSGFLAFVVAFVPAEPPDKPAEACNASNIPTDGQIADAITTNMVALLVVAWVAAAVARWLVRNPRPEERSTVTRSLLSSSGLLSLGGLVFIVDRPLFLEHAHLGAAGAMFGGMMLVVGLNAREARRSTKVDRETVVRQLLYPRIFLAMAVTVIVIGGATIAGLSHGALVLEALLLVEFGVFWFVQTQALWNDEPRSNPPVVPEPDVTPSAPPAPPAA
jgi:hypothetical protein